MKLWDRVRYLDAHIAKDSAAVETAPYGPWPHDSISLCVCSQAQRGYTHYLCTCVFPSVKGSTEYPMHDHQEPQDLVMTMPTVEGD